MNFTRIFAILNAFHPGRSLLRRNFFWTFIGNTVYSACQWGLLSVLAKLTTPEKVGEYALAVAVTAPLLYFANFGIGIMLVTDTNRQFRFAQYRTARLLLIAASLIAAVIICVVSRFSAEVVLLTLIVAISQSSDCLSELYRSVMLRSERMSRIAVSLVIRGAASVATAAAVLFYSKNLVWALLAMAAARMTVLFLYDMPMGKDSPVAAEIEDPYNDGEEHPKSILDRVSKALSFPAVWKITSAALPLTIITILTSLVINLPRYFIESYAGHRQLGIFAAMWSMLTAGNMIAIALGQAIFPRLSKLYAVRDIAGFRRLIGYALQIGLGLGLMGVAGAIVAGRQILTLAYRAEYAEQRWLFVAVMGVGTLVYIITLLGNVATSARAFKSQALLMSIVATVTFLSSALFVPKFGVWGAVWAVGLGCLTHMAGLMFIVLELLKREQDRQTVLSLAA
ncbi:MAG: oligosaccharide flippase family protein [Acidobacteriota bacterium]|nr:oligosaccharide flippase family protein [Acidobacteriota bacterium]